MKNSYRDPDKKIGRFTAFCKGKDYDWGLDGYCGINHLMMVYEPEEIPEKLYIVRSSCLMWPRHKIPTFNTYRRKKYHDRVDFTLHAIKEYIESKTAIWDPVIYNTKSSSSKDWIDSFNCFNDFIDTMGYQHLVDKNEKNEYIVVDYMKGGKIKSLSDIQIPTKEYFDNLIERIKNDEEKIYDSLKF